MPDATSWRVTRDGQTVYLQTAGTTPPADAVEISADEYASAASQARYARLVASGVDAATATQITGYTP